MAADILNELEALDQLPRHYQILEISADLRERQLATLSTRAARHLARVSWLDELPAAVHGVIVANEVLDALPVDRFRIRSGRVNALGVSWQQTDSTGRKRRQRHAARAQGSGNRGADR